MYGIKNYALGIDEIMRCAYSMHMQAENPILKARKDLKMTQEAFAAAMGVNLSTVWRWEKGKLPISPIVTRAAEQLVAEKSGRAA